MKAPKKQDKSVRISQREKLAVNLNIREFAWTEKQKQLIQLIQDKETKVIFLAGPAGTSKTCVAAFTALQALNDKKASEIAYIRQPKESSKYSLGFLPGTSEEKMHPYLSPLMEKLDEFLTKTSVDFLIKDERISGVPVGYLRGRTFNSTYVLVDESQNLTVQDLLLVMSRLGKHGKMIIMGDTMQSDIDKSAFAQVMHLFDDEASRGKGIHIFKFGKQDILRNEILSFIIEKFENYKG